MNKIVVIGGGHVGFRYIEKLVLEPNLYTEIVLIDLEGKSFQGELLDLKQGLSLKTSTISLRMGTYEDCEDASVVIITAGVKQTRSDRLEDLEAANEIIRDICRNISKTSFQGVILVATNPVDVISQLVATYLDYPYEKVIGSGTMLDTVRLKTLLAEKLQVASCDIQVYVLGEHGNSQFVAWSNANIGLQNLSNFLTEEEKERVAYQTAKMGGEIVRLKQYTNDGIASCLVRLTMAILLDQKQVYAVSHYQSDYDLYFSTPAVIGCEGIEKDIKIKLSEEEKGKLAYSVQVIQKALEHILPPELY